MKKPNPDVATRLRIEHHRERTGRSGAPRQMSSLRLVPSEPEPASTALDTTTTIADETKKGPWARFRERLKRWLSGA